MSIVHYFPLITKKKLEEEDKLEDYINPITEHKVHVAFLLFAPMLLDVTAHVLSAVFFCVDGGFRRSKPSIIELRR